MTAIILLFFLGLLLLALGGDSLSEHAAALAGRLRIPPMVVGATVAAVGTTLPELAVSLTAALNGSGQVACGNALGSIVCNSCLIGGICALMRPISGIRRRSVAKRLCFFLLALCFTAFSAVKTGELGVGLGIVLLCILGVYALTNASDGKKASSAPDERAELICVGILVGTAALYLGSGLLVDNGLLLAEVLAVKPGALASTLIALGTSLPELAAALLCSARKRGELAFGILIGANILNLLLVTGLPALIAPISTETELWRSLAAAGVAMCAFSLPPLFTGRTFRWQGAVLIIMYIGYVALNFI